MATIRKLPSGKYNVQIRREGHPPLSDTFKTKTAAKAWATKIEGDIDQAKHYGFSRVRTLADAVDAFTSIKTTIKTADDRNRHLAWWREHFGNRKLFHFTADVVEEGRERLAAENIEPNAKKPARLRAPQTVRHYLMSLSACMDYAKRKKRWIEKNPVSDIDAPPVSPGRIRWLAADERQRLLAACDKSGNPDLGLIVRIALASGARQAEIMHLRWRMVDLSRECAFLPTSKTGEPRVLPLPGSVADALRARAKIRSIGSDLVFPSPDDPNRPRNIWQAWDVARKLAGLPDFRFHDLRHTAATEMLRAGVDSRIVATVLGHRSMNMMRRYAHVAPELVVGAAKKAHENGGG
jgi:integrase